MSNKEWSYEVVTTSLADTGDFESYIEFKNGKDILHSSGDNIEGDEECQELCNVLDKFPDLWSHTVDGLEFENEQLKKEKKSLIDLISKLRQGNMCSVVGDEMIENVLCGMSDY